MIAVADASLPESERRALIDAYWDEVEDRVRFLDALVEGGRYHEALTLCSSYLDALVQNLAAASYITGAPESDESLGVGGYLSISPLGVVSEVEPVRDPFSPSDPGSPARLGVTPGTATPWLMMIDEDGVRIYTRQG